ncbi:MAG TPA: hypothetical protein VKA53_10530, partial [Thermoanaerobaculia bacterium]|nr:hypothetical protein [Thermoanaerobaculia bacterium]
SSHPLERGERGAIRYAGNGEILFASLLLAEQGGLEATSFRAYDELLALIEETDYQHPLRAWNYMPASSEEERGLERYRRFCAGRHEALARHGFSFDHDLPAASAVGHRGQGLYVTLLAAREAGLQVENRRQVNAWRYPPQYGPRSPSFARATLKRWTGEWHLYVAGTASITGHESRHPGDLEAQLEETLRNLDAIEADARERIAAAGDMVRVVGGLARIYLRDPGAAAAVAAFAAVRFEPETHVLILEADICRRELLVEVELIRRYRIFSLEP